MLLSAPGAQPASGQGFDEPFAPVDIADDSWVETTTIWVFEEIAAIAAVGAFEQDPLVDRILAEVPLPGDSQIQTMVDFDEDNSFLLQQLEADGRELSPAVVGVLNVLPPGVVAGVRGGDVEFVDPMPWLVAATDLLLRDGRAGDRDRVDSEVSVIGHFFDLLSEGREPTSEEMLARLREDSAPTTLAERDEIEPSSVVPAEPTSDNVAPPLVAAPTTSAAAASPATTSAVAAAEPTAAAPNASDGPAEASSSSTAPLVAIAGVVLLGLSIAVALLLRRRRDRGIEPEVEAAARPTFDGLLDASRRMTAALDVSTVASIAVDEVTAMFGATSAVMTSASGSSEVMAGSADLAAGRGADALVERAIGVIQPTTGAIDRDGVRSSVLVVPIAAGGSVVAVLSVQRSGARPFGRADVDQVRPLGPLVGSALAAATAHSSAVTQADVDGLTGLKNRRRLDRDLAELPRSCVVGFAMIDVDHFKQFNDTNGHQAGDTALRMVADCLAANVRSTDVVYRYGGEEFSVVLRDTSEAEAVEVLERVRAAVESAAIPGGEHQPAGRVTISVGLVVTGPSDPSSELLAETADGALYRAKHDGRNRVVVAQ